jgi:hypothetical protein
VTFFVEFSDVGDSELHPLLTILKVIKDEYSSLKPEVYKTLIAILYDYDPSLGQEHRDRVLSFTSFTYHKRYKPIIVGSCIRAERKIGSIGLGLL